MIKIVVTGETKANEIVFLKNLVVLFSSTNSYPIALDTYTVNEMPTQLC